MDYLFNKLISYQFCGIPSGKLTMERKMLRQHYPPAKWSKGKFAVTSNLNKVIKGKFILCLCFFKIN